MAKSDLHDRLAGLRIDVSHETRDRHIAAISEAVRNAPPARTRKRLGFRRRWAVAIASLAAFVAPVGTAVAAEGALPGELLYPVKQVSEQIRGVFDEDLPARHRVEELERLVEVDADPAAIRDAQGRAEDAVGALDQPGELAGRLERARRQVRVSGGSGQEPTGGVTNPGPGNGSTPPNEPGQGDGSGDRSDDPSQDRDRDRDSTGDDGPTPTTGPGGDAGTGGTGSGGDGSGGDGSGGDGSGGGSGSGGDGSGGDGSGGDASGGSGGSGSGSGSGGG